MNTKKKVLSELFPEVAHLITVMGTDLRVRILESPLRGKLAGPRSIPVAWLLPLSVAVLLLPAYSAGPCFPHVAVSAFITGRS